MNGLFDRYNKRYWGGRLPAYEVITDDSRSGGYTNRKARKIHVNHPPGLLFRRVLLHEMSHASTNDFHGPVWRAEMARIRALGAPILKEDYEQYARRHGTENAADILENIADAARQPDTASIPVNTLVQDICYSYEITTNDGSADSAFSKRFVKKARAVAASARRV